MRNFAPGLALPKMPPRSPLQAEILWSCQRGGSRQFPRDLAAIYDRARACDPVPITAFCDAVIHSMKRVWVVDEYFLAQHKNASADARISSILKWLPDNLIASDIRILTAKHTEVTEKMLERFEDRARAINARQPNRPKECSIQVSTRLKKGLDIHDRFAVVDDELWHFGATVGGFHTSVNAVSRGWDAVDSGAIEFFELAWDKCKER